MPGLDKGEETWTLKKKAARLETLKARISHRNQRVTEEKARRCHRAATS
jgi:hypothetical protein